MPIKKHNFRLCILFALLCSIHLSFVKLTFRHTLVGFSYSIIDAKINKGFLPHQAVCASSPSVPPRYFFYTNPEMVWNWYLYMQNSIAHILSALNNLILYHSQIRQVPSAPQVDSVCYCYHIITYTDPMQGLLIATYLFT